VPPPAPVDDAAPPDLTLRERRADRRVRGALIGLFAWPVFLLAVYRLIQVANSGERPRPEYLRKANLVTVINAVPLLLVALVCCLPAYVLMRWGG
jgi:hypothetical protein